MSKEATRTYLLNTSLEIKNSKVSLIPAFLWRRHYDKFILDKTQLRSNYLNHHHTDIYTPTFVLKGEEGFFRDVSGGAEWGIESISSTNLGKHARYHESLFIDAGKSLLDDFNLDMSFRTDYFEGTEIFYTGSSRLSLNLNKTESVSIGVSRNIRMPTFTELYYSDPVTSGNTALSAEKSLNYELEHEFNDATFVLKQAIFLRSQQDKIDYVKASPQQSKWQAQNIDSYDILGAELFLSRKLNKLFSVNATYTFCDQIDSGGKYIYKYGPNFSRHIFSGVLNLKTPLCTQATEIIYKKKPGRSGWLVANLAFSRKLGKNFNAFIKITNIFNTEYQEIEGIAQPGRWAEAGVRLEW